jgi:hypothetical protein
VAPTSARAFSSKEEAEGKKGFFDFLRAAEKADEEASQAGVKANA